MKTFHVGRQRRVTYEWCQYEGEPMFTVRRVIAEDFCKVYSQAEAVSLVRRFEEEECGPQPKGELKPLDGDEKEVAKQ